MKKALMIILMVMMTVIATANTTVTHDGNTGSIAQELSYMIECDVYSSTVMSDTHTQLSIHRGLHYINSCVHRVIYTPTHTGYTHTRAIRVCYM